MSGAVDFLADHDATTDDGIGVMGFCMGGMLTFVLAALRPDKVKAAVPFYGFPQGDDQPDYSKIEAAIQGHMAEHDDFFPPSAAMHLEEELKALGKDVTITVHLGTGHAFMAPHNALGTQNQDKYDEIWPQATAFLHEKLAERPPHDDPIRRRPLRRGRRARPARPDRARAAARAIWRVDRDRCAPSRPLRRDEGEVRPLADRSGRGGSTTTRTSRRSTC